VEKNKKLIDSGIPTQILRYYNELPQQNFLQQFPTLIHLYSRGLSHSQIRDEILSWVTNKYPLLAMSDADTEHSFRFNNIDIVPEYNMELKLSDILLTIKKLLDEGVRIPNSYILQSCRGLLTTEENIVCGDDDPFVLAKIKSAHEVPKFINFISEFKTLYNSINDNDNSYLRAFLMNNENDVYEDEEDIGNHFICEDDLGHITCDRDDFRFSCHMLKLKLIEIINPILDNLILD
jgi:hypothetical protein